MEDRNHQLHVLNRALEDAAANGDLNQVQQLINQGATNVTDALLAAAEEGHLPVVAYTVGLRSDIVNIKGYFNHALALASEHDHPDVVEYLVEHGADNVNMALKWAARHDRLGLVDFLVNHGASNLNEALIEAVTADHLDVVRYMVNHGATDLHLASWIAHHEQHPAIREYLDSL